MASTNGSNMKRILFVDDDPNVLSGLNRALHSLREEWDLQFACGALEALTCLQSCPADVVVADARMPGMDGLQLLLEIKKRYPQAVRIMLSGQSDQETMLRSLGPVHTYLSKPCDAATMKSAVARACALRDLLDDEPLKRLISQLGTLPSLPASYAELIQELQSSNANLLHVSRIIAKDIGMTAKILQLVNSGFFGLRKRISSPDHAVMLLGLETIKVMALSLHVFSQFQQRPLKDFSLDRLMNHSMAVSTQAKLLATHERFAAHLVEEAFTTGMLHDLGKLILATKLPKKYEAASQLAKAGSLRMWQAEKEIFGASHAEVGAYLLALWGLPNPIVEAIAYHHCPQASGQRTLGPAAVVHVVNVFQQQSKPEDCVGIPDQLDLDYLNALGASERIPQWRALLGLADPAVAP